MRVLRKVEEIKKIGKKAADAGLGTFTQFHNKWNTAGTGFMTDKDALRAFHEDRPVICYSRDRTLRLLFEEMGFHVDYVLATKNLPLDEFPVKEVHERLQAILDARTDDWDNVLGHHLMDYLNTIALVVTIRGERYLMDPTGGNFQFILLPPTETEMVVNNPGSYVSYTRYGEDMDFRFYDVPTEVVETFIKIRQRQRAEDIQFLASDPGLFIKDDFRVVLHTNEERDEYDKAGDHKHESQRNPYAIARFYRVGYIGPYVMPLYGEFIEKFGPEITDELVRAYHQIAHGDLLFVKLRQPTVDTNRIVINGKVYEIPGGE
jgi:hypothetical protein